MDPIAAMRDRLRELATKCLTTDSAPGISLALTDREGLVLADTYGCADLAARRPVALETLFEIGSIGKSFTAIMLLQLRDEGAIDFHVPVATYLPWFVTQTNFAPITIHHLLSHSAGIIGGTDFTPDPRAEVWAMREIATGCPPGERFSYSNLGYKLLGLVIEEVTGQTYAAAVAARIFAPLGMTESEGAITHAIRPRLAVGYVPLFDDRPTPPDVPLVPATWLETNTGDGCISTNAIDLATYLRMLLNGGAGPEGRLLSEHAFADLVRPVMDAGHGNHYAYGLSVCVRDGQHRIGHGGGMVGYTSEMIGEPEHGIGVALTFNARFAHGDILEEYALALLRAWKLGAPLPAVPALPDPSLLDDPAPYVGVYGGEDRRVEVTATVAGLQVTADGVTAPLTRLGGDTFLVEHPRFPLGAVGFGRARAVPASGAAPGLAAALAEEAEVVTAEPMDLPPASAPPVIELVTGHDWYPGAAYPGDPAAAIPAHWEPFIGHYRSHNPWFSAFRIAAGGGQLHLVYNGTHWTPLTLLPDGTFRANDDPRAPERLRFDMLAGGVALRATYCGADYYRFFTP